MKTSTQQSSIKTHLSQWIALGLLAGIGTLASGSFRAAIAQSTTPQPLQDFQNTDKSNGLFNNTNGGPSSMFDLIHRAMQAPSQTEEDFTDSQQDSLTSAAQEFRAKQQERLQSQPQPTSSTPASPTAPIQN